MAQRHAGTNSRCKNHCVSKASRQIVAYSDLVFGFQCHMELTKEVVALLIENDDLSEAANYRFVDEPEILMNHDYDEMNQKLHKFLDKLAKSYQAQS